MPCSLKNIIIAKYVNIEFCLHYHLISQIAGFFPVNYIVGVKKRKPIEKIVFSEKWWQPFMIGDG